MGVSCWPRDVVEVVSFRIAGLGLLMEVFSRESWAGFGILQVGADLLEGVEDAAGVGEFDAVVDDGLQDIGEGVEGLLVAGGGGDGEVAAGDAPGGCGSRGGGGAWGDGSSRRFRRGGRVRRRYGRRQRAWVQRTRMSLMTSERRFGLWCGMCTPSPRGVFGQSLVGKRLKSGRETHPSPDLGLRRGLVVNAKARHPTGSYGFASVSIIWGGVK